MARILGLLLLIALLGNAVTPLPTAEARDGAYRGPGGMVPPGLREPSDPTPPPPPPPSGPPAQPGVPLPTTPTPVPTTPVPSTPAPTPPPAPRPPVVRPGPPQRFHAVSFEDWRFWYEHNRDLVEADFRRAEEPHPDPRAADAYEAIVRTAKGEESPHQAIHGAALLALGKIAHTAEHVAILREVLTKDPSVLVRESAALGLGLLRRSNRHAQLEAAVYDEARTLLLDTVLGEANQARTRGFAALAVGLLGDQPTEKDPAVTTARLFEALRARASNVDIPVGVVRALMLQPRASFTPEQRTTLRQLAYEGTLSGGRAPDVLRARALEALGVVGEAEDAARMEKLLASERKITANVKRSAAIGLGILAAQSPLEERLSIVDVLLRTAAYQRDDSTRLFALGALVPALLWGSPEDREAVLRGSLAPEVLLATAAYGSHIERPYAALVLGWILHDWRYPPLPDTLAAFDTKARRVLREGAADAELAPSARAAFALALGLSGDEEHAPALMAILADQRNDKTLRAYAAAGLAYLDPTDDRLAAASAARAERSSEELRRTATRALGMMRVADPDQLAQELHDVKSMSHKGEAAAALARLGSPEAREALLRLATDPKETAPTRASAMAGLGRLLDPNFAPSLARLTAWLNYRASTDLINQLYALL